jgi:hypothetical protein
VTDPAAHIGGAHEYPAIVGPPERVLAFIYQPACR